MSKQQTAQCGCYCGNQRLRKRDHVAGYKCCNCSQEIANERFTCFAGNCQFKEINSFTFTLCEKCLDCMPPHQTAEEMMSFALQTSRRIIKEKIENKQQIEIYLYRIRHNLLKIITTYFEHNVVSPATHKALKDEFDDIYEFGLKYIGEMMALKHLGLSEDIWGIKEKDEETEEKEEKEIKQKWVNIHQNKGYIADNEQYIEYNANKCENIDDCVCVARIAFLLRIYDEHFIKKEEKDDAFINILNKCMMRFDIANIVNDFVHIMDYHQNENDSERLNAGKVIEICGDKECDADMRRFDENEHEKYKNILHKNIETKEQIIYEIMDLLHSFLAHQNGTMKYNNNARRNPPKHNKFATHIDIEQDEEKKTQNDDKAKAIQKDAFSFGVSFKYWSHWKNKPEEYIKTPKYASLKEELLMNNIHSLSTEQLDQFIEKTIYYLQCDAAKRIKAEQRGGSNEYYEIPSGLSLSIPHLLALTLYTNLTDLQFKFKKFGTRKMKNTDSMRDIKTRNMQIANWFKLIFEAVIFYGAKPKPTDLLYHGISVKLYFSEFAPKFKAPISTTTQFNVAQQFADTGVIIAVKPNNSCTDRYFAVQWFSNFPEEREYFFAEALGLYITDIRECDGALMNCNNSVYLRAMRLLDQIFKGYYFIFDLEKKRKSSQRILFKLLTHYLKDIAVSTQCIMDEIKKELSVNNMNQTNIASLFDFFALNEYDSDAVFDDLMEDEESESGVCIASNIRKCLNMLSLSSSECIKAITFWTIKVPEYINDLFHYLLQSIAQKQSVLFVVESDFRLLSQPLQSILLTEEKDGVKSALFGDNENKICFLEEYIWSMDQDEFHALKALNKGGKVQSDLYSYHASDIHITFKQCMMRSGSSFPEFTLLGFELVSFPRDKRIQCDYCFAVDEVKWCLNGGSLVLHQNRSYVYRRAFPNSFLNRISSITIRFAVRFSILK